MDMPSHRRYADDRHRRHARHRRAGKAAHPEWDDNPPALDKLIGPGRRDVPSTDRSDHAVVRSVYWRPAVSVRHHYVDLVVLRCRRARPPYERHNDDLATTGGADVADRPPRTLLAQRIRERCLTFEEFVQHAEVFAREHGEPGTLSLRHLQRLVSGRKPDTLRPATARLLERLLDEPIAALLAPPPTTSSQDAGGHHHRDLPLAAEAENSIVVPARTHDGRVVFVILPRRLLVGSLGAAALVGMADAQSGHQLVRIPESEVSSVFDVDPLEHFQQVKKTLMDSDNLFGAGSVIQSTQEQISTIQRFRQSYRGAGRQKLLQIQTQFADLCGWAYQDSCDYRASLYWSGRALEWSHMCGDREATSFILARRSHLAADMGDPTEAVEAAEAALQMMSGESSRVTVFALTCAAHGHALQRDSVDCERTYAMAQDLLERQETDPSCPWALLLDRSYIEVHRARSLALLADYAGAVKSFQQAISALPHGYRRDRGVYLAREAVAHVGNGDAEQACTVGFQALTIGAETGSGRIVGELESLDAALKQFPLTSSVTDFREAMNETFSYRRLRAT